MVAERRIAVFVFVVYLFFGFVRPDRLAIIPFMSSLRVQRVLLRMYYSARMMSHAVPCREMLGLGVVCPPPTGHCAPPQEIRSQTHGILDTLVLPLFGAYISLDAPSACSSGSKIDRVQLSITFCMEVAFLISVAWRTVVTICLEREIDVDPMPLALKPFLWWLTCETKGQDVGPLL